MHNLIDCPDKLVCFKKNKKRILCSVQTIYWTNRENKYVDGWSMGEMNPAMLKI